MSGARHSQIVAQATREIIKFRRNKLKNIIKYKLYTSVAKDFVRFNGLSLKCKRFKPSACKDIGIRTFELVAKNQFPMDRELFELGQFKDVFNAAQCLTF